MDDFTYYRSVSRLCFVPRLCSPQYRRKTLSSFLWSTWLRFPQSIRCRFYRFLLLFSRPSSNSPHLLRLPFGLYAKLRSSGGKDIIQEALALQFVADYTSIPVPEVLDLFEASSSSLDGPVMILSRIRGTPISRISSLDALTDDQQTKIADVLRDWLNQLQYLQSPYGRTLCGYLGAEFTSYRINTSTTVGPYRSQDRFHETACCSMTSSHDPKVCALAAIIRQKRYDISFVHGNVSPENVLLDRKGVPVGLVGWECAAWMPSYWELTAGAWSVRGRAGEDVWSHILVRCLPQYTDELKVERELWKTYTPY
ncbi:hypothetical protein NP233_g13062 [Leucocoprinus birnbaumii]|uniref:Aminoglycoside phosphotransferase domain-containing protein n=1 Tax=Leucocoprinus birnbaumii TaxID=56174 RepID=A0AAD5YJU6_9AGAR|nr:hypothetical protein NP233_g13062 [Leucocoprinus birnbaumii]